MIINKKVTIRHLIELYVNDDFTTATYKAGEFWQRCINALKTKQTEAFKVEYHIIIGQRHVIVKNATEYDTFLMEDVPFIDDEYMLLSYSAQQVNNIWA